jgi:hypothetical protein
LDQSSNFLIAGLLLVKSEEDERSQYDGESF